MGGRVHHFVEPPGGSRVENELVKLKKSIYYQRNKDVTAAWANAISLYCFTFKFQFMAKTTFNANIVACPEGQDYKTWIKSQMSDCKNPFASQCPFKQNQEVEFENIVPVSWEHEKFGTGKYLAIKFKGIDATLSLSSLLKTDNAYKDQNDKNISTIKNVGGLAKIVKDGRFDDNLIDAIYSFFAKGKFKIKLTTYYRPVSYSSTLKNSNLMNVVKVEE